jgi:outer membrane biosynthesis protein TonB
MAKNEVGEFELVLGNKQLLTVFFIVVTLLGVFFTMGYIVGRNSGGAGTIEAANRRPTVIDPPGGASTPAAEPTPAPAKPEPKQPEPAAAPAPTAPEPKPIETHKAEEKKAEEPPKAEKKPDKKEDKKPAKAVEPPAPVRAAGGPLAGTYLQLAAVPKAEADLLISVLQKKGFSAAAGPGPEGSNLFRVLVGPLAGADAVSKTRTSLDESGMPGSKALVRRF